MTKHHLLFLYIFVAIFSANSMSMDSTAADEPKHRLFGKLKSVFHRDKAPRPNKISPALHDHLVQERNKGEAKQEALVYSETFPGSDEIGVIKEGANRLIYPYGVPNVSTKCAVSVCTALDQSFLAYIEPEGCLKVVQTRDLIHWSKPTNVFGDAVQTTNFLHCFSFNDKPYITCGNLLTHSKDGKTWEKPTPLSFGDSTLYVTMQAHNDTVYAMLTGKDNCVYYTTSRDTLNWEPLERVRKWKTQFPVCIDTGIIYIASRACEWDYIPEAKESAWKTTRPISMCKSGSNRYLAYLDEDNNVYMGAPEVKPLKRVKTKFPVCIFEHTFYTPRYNDELFIAYIGLDGRIYMKSYYEH
jgi:hypothetical protein